MTKTILTFGDSNTHGTPPMHDSSHHPRHKRRWPVVLAETLGCTLIEEGLPGRMAAGHGDTVMGPEMNGQLGLRIALASHGPIDLLTIMLGTNDLKLDHGKTATQIAASIAGLIKIAQVEELQAKHGGFDILLICPPPILEGGTFASDFAGQRVVSEALPAAYAFVAETRGVWFMDAGAHIISSEVDAIHFDAATHEVLGRAVAAEIERRESESL
uniref:GDSL-type esterase/lipase family protein n=2 Tax=Yoonia sp. TaxID=2212373 RepID=UPI004047C198